MTFPQDNTGFTLSRSEVLEQNISKNDYLPHAALLGVQALFGSLPVIGKVVLAVMPPIALVGFRVGITALILVVVQAIRGRLWLRSRRDYLIMAGLSVFGVTLNQLLFIGGLSLTKASNTSLLAATIPIFTLAVSVVAGYERLRTGKVLGMLLAVIGVVVLIDPRSASFSSETTLGDILIVINSLSYGIYVALSKDVITRNGPFRSMMWIFVFAAIICVPLGGVSLYNAGAEGIGPGVWLLVLYIAVVATAGPYLLNAYAISKVPASVVAIYIYLQPIIGFVLAVLFLRESIGPAFITATALVFAGVWLASKKRNPRPEIA